MLPLSTNPCGLIERLVHAAYCVLLDRDSIQTPFVRHAIETVR